VIKSDQFNRLSFEHIAVLYLILESPITNEGAWKAMIWPEIRRIYSPDLEPPNLPRNPGDCEILFQVFVGPKDDEGEEAFSFTVMTASRFTKDSDAQWGRGKLIVAAFEWPAVIQAVAELLAQCARPSWGEVVAELNKELIWDFDGYKPADSS
jgi:hypothetical protein